VLISAGPGIYNGMQDQQMVFPDFFPFPPEQQNCENHNGYAKLGVTFFIPNIIFESLVSFAIFS
jgi:hypothetical protein